MNFANPWIHLWILFTFPLAYGEVKEKDLPLRSAKVLFIVDESNSIWEPDFQRQLRFVQETVKRFEIGKNYTRVALATYSVYSKVLFGFDSYNDSEALINATGKIRRPEGYRTRFVPALKSFFQAFDVNFNSCLSYLMLKAKAGNAVGQYRRKNGELERMAGELDNEDDVDFPVNIVVLMGDGIVEDFNEARNVADCLRRQNIHLFGVAVGKRQIRRTMDEIANTPSHTYRISIDNSDPPILPTDDMADCKPAPIWELMVKYKAMAEECIPHRKRIVLNVIMDIVSKKSWRYTTFVKIAEDLFLRLGKKFYATKNKNFLNIRFHPRGYGPPNANRLKDKDTWLQDEKVRYRDIIELGKKTRKGKRAGKRAEQGTEQKHTRKKSWEQLNSVLTKIAKSQDERRQHVIIYMTDRETEQMPQSEGMSKAMRQSIQQGMRSSYEMFAVAIGTRIKGDRLSHLLRRYYTNPGTRMFIFNAQLKTYLEEIASFAELFCPFKQVYASRT